LPVFFHNADISFLLKRKTQYKKWICSEISRYSFIPGNLNVVFCSDAYLLGINQQYLRHNYYTDIVTFNYNTDKVISGDLYISLDRVRDNAISLKSDFLLELNRVVIHGILHLIGFDDCTAQLKEEIHKKEDEALLRFFDFN
jgi:rRNA maturation RNase YbeY